MQNEMIAHLKTLPFRLIFPKSNIENFLSYVTDLKFVFSLRSFVRIYYIYIYTLHIISRPSN